MTSTGPEFKLHLVHAKFLSILDTEFMIIYKSEYTVLVLEETLYISNP